MKGKSLRQRRREATGLAAMHDRSLALALTQSGPRGRMATCTHPTQMVAKQHKTHYHCEPLPLSAGEQTHAQRAEEESGWESSQRTTRSTRSSVWKKKKTRGSGRGGRSRSREATLESGQLPDYRRHGEKKNLKNKANIRREEQTRLQQGRLADESVPSFKKEE